ncbi:hypothetical protein [Sulfurimonas sp.]
MYQKYQSGLVETITINAGIKAKEYFGELENPQDGKFLKGSLPIIYIDFIEDDTSKPRTIDLNFALYIVHASYSKNELTRKDTQNEIHDLLKKVYKHLAFQSIEDSEPIELKKLKKIYDANAANAYVTVYKKDISMSIPNPILTGDI